MKEELQNIPLLLWLLIFAILICQGTWLFYDSKKRGNNKWFWGIWGLLNFPTPLILYLIIARKVLIKRKNSH